MTTSLRVLTYNVQMRSWGLEALAQGSLTPYENVEERAEAIATRILRSPQQYDVLCLQEVFDEDGRKGLVKRLSDDYPHRIEKSDGDGISVVTGTALGVAGISALIPGGAALAVVAGVIGVIGLATTKFEDSGLMIFSKRPFATIPVDPAFRDALEANGVSLPPTLPGTAFEVYDEAEGADDYAAKGVLYVRLAGEGPAVHLLTSHTQADATDSLGAGIGTRRAQLEQAYGLLERMAVDVDEAEVLLCGDLNIEGVFHKGAYGPEWTAMFDAPGTHFTDQLLDAWTREQSPGDPGRGRTLRPDQTPLPADRFDRGITTQVQRLDYAVRGRGPSQHRLALQHMCIAYDIAVDPAAPTYYTSDHLPVRIDLDLERPHCSVLTAEPLVAAPDTTVDGLLMGGQMHWYRIEERGGYRIDLTQGLPSVALDVFTADNLSVPVAPFTLLEDSSGPERPATTRYALPSAPFFLRLSLPDRRRGEAFYEVTVHRYLGTGPSEAIPLLRGVPETFRPNVNAAHSVDDPATPWDEHDSVWFVAALDTAADGSLPVASTVTVSDPVTRAFGVLVLARAPGGPTERLAEAGPGPEVTAVATYVRPLTGYILVRRDRGQPTAPEFTVTLRSDISYLYGNPADPSSRALALARLFCRDETNGAFGSEWGSDDIAVNIEVNRTTVVHIDNNDQLEFDDDSMRDLPMIDVVRYTGEATFELVEMDDLSAVDRASVRIPQFAALAGDERVLYRNPSGALTKFTIIFDPADDEDDDDDGIYDLTITVSPEPPPQQR